ncbi:MAG: 5-methyltetrahydropteroyltriglutamate--homocysteine S-methyltransferase, partial [Litorivicinaceae bacterium]|nr:5-methyltetrahydropteroyltriglutamate--homocysteine S-methyltransferase [Litorivicinaceae bacterium]
MSQPKIPPFRADHVGSLLRPDIVKAARKGFYEDQSISNEELASAEDEAIKGVVKLQESVGLNVVTDGEARRSFWHYDFMGALDGFDLEDRSE